MVVENETHRATPGGVGSIKAIGNYAGVIKIGYDTCSLIRMHFGFICIFLLCNLSRHFLYKLMRNCDFSLFSSVTLS